MDQQNDSIYKQQVNTFLLKDRGFSQMRSFSPLIAFSLIILYTGHGYSTLLKSSTHFLCGRYSPLLFRGPSICYANLASHQGTRLGGASNFHPLSPHHMGNVQRNGKGRGGIETWPRMPVAGSQLRANPAPSPLFLTPRVHVLQCFSNMRHPHPPIHSLLIKYI